MEVRPDVAEYSVELMSPALRAANLVLGDALVNGLISLIDTPLLTIRSLPVRQVSGQLDS